MTIPFESNLLLDLKTGSSVLVSKQIFPDFFSPRRCNKRITVSFAIRTSSMVFPKISISSRYMTIFIANLLKIDIGTFRSLVKVCGAEPKPKCRQRNSYKLFDHRKCIIFLDSLFNETEK